MGHQTSTIRRRPLTSISLNLYLMSRVLDLTLYPVTPERIHLHSLSPTFGGPHPMLVATTIMRSLTLCCMNFSSLLKSSDNVDLLPVELAHHHCIAHHEAEGPVEVLEVEEVDQEAVEQK